jgi:hypothetical protein
MSMTLVNGEAIPVIASRSYEYIAIFLLLGVTLSIVDAGGSAPLILSVSSFDDLLLKYHLLRDHAQEALIHSASKADSLVCHLPTYILSMSNG